jgi:hypothetical protein
MPLTHWVPSEKRWNDSAHRETTAAYPGQADDRKVALCIWLLATHPQSSLPDVERLAQDDPAMAAKQEGGTKITSNHLRQARKILGLTTSSRKRSPTKKAKGLSKIEKALLARFNESTDLIEAYVVQATALALVQEAFDKAKAALLAMPKEHAETLAEVDPKAAEILSAEGILGGDDAPAERRQGNEPQNTFVVWPSDEDRS